MVLFRFLHAWIFPVNLAGDEAYYWDWGRNLDYGYYSKPPFIAWLYALVAWVGGEGSLFAIRATAILLGGASLCIQFFLGNSLFDEKTGWIAVILGVAAPGNSVLSFFLTIDAPLVFFWSIALWMLWRYVNGRRPGLALVTLFAALALGHLTKQMMMIFPILAVIFLAGGKETRAILKRPLFWLAVFGSYASLIPPLIWNAHHDWITLRHTGHHFAAPTGAGSIVGKRIGDFLSFLGTQTGVISPAIAVLLYGIALGGLKRIRSVSDPVRLLLVFCAIPLVFMLLLALRQPMQPNWPAVYYVAGIVLTAAWLRGDIGLPFPPDRWRRFCKSPFALKVFLVGSAILLGYFYFGTFLFQAMGKSGHLADPDRRLKGNEMMAAEFQKIRKTIPDDTDLFIVTLGHRNLTSEIAFLLPDHPRVYRWEPSDRITSQYELWPDPAENGFQGKDGLVLSMEQPELPSRFREAFQSTRLIGKFEVHLAYDRVVRFYVFRVRQLKDWPKGAPLSKSP